MSTFRNPVGPRSSRVYWRRRVVVLLALILVLVVIAMIVSRLSPDDNAGANTQSSSDAPAAATTPAAAPELVEGAPCDPAAVKIAAVTDKESYAAEELPQLSLSLTNTSGVACTFNAGTTQQVFEITSGDDIYWSSKDCETEPVDASVLLEPNVAQSSAPISWDRTRSSATTCEGERAPVPGGGATFNLNVTVGEATSAEPKSFLLN